jgi:hypothetical protein
MASATQIKNQGRQLNLVQDNDTGMVQSQIRKVPTDAFMWMAAGSILGSATLKFMGRDKDSLFVGQWAPTFAILGVLDRILRTR